MRKSITLRAFPAAMPTRERLALAREAGFAGVEINLEPSEEYPLTSPVERLHELRELVHAHGLAVSGVYSREQWRAPITSQNPETRQSGQRLLEELVQAAVILGTDAVLVVPGAVDNSLFAARPEIVPYDVAYTNAKATVRTVAHSLCAQARVTLGIENVWGKFLLSPLEMARFIDEAASPWVGAWFDVGNVLRTGYPEDWIRILGPRVRRVHFKDFRLAAGDINGFVGLLQGDVNWPAVRAGLEAIGYDGWVSAEVLPAYRYHSERLIHETSAAMDAILSG